MEDTSGLPELAEEILDEWLIGKTNALCLRRPTRHND